MPARIGPPDQGLLEADSRRELLQQVTGLDPVLHGRHVLTDGTITSAERLSLVDAGGTVVVAFCPAELKDQAMYLYDHGRAAAMIAAGRATGWTVEGRPQLAFRNSAPQVRLYLQPVTAVSDVDQYARRWSGADRARIGAHSVDKLRNVLWPWLKEVGYATDADDPALREYVVLLGARDAFFRAALSFTQLWNVGANDASRDLAAKIRAAINEPLVAAGEIPLRATSQ